jgi:DNA-binding GntR family transcriptional regulator
MGGMPGKSAELPSDRVARELRKRIEAGEWDPGEQLPTASEIADEYGVSRGAVTRAVGILAAEGLLRTVPRWGVFRAE